jgi:atypical dual specificity phosphatase
MKLFHYLFDKLYPLIRFVHERVNGNEWFTEITPRLWLGGAPTYQRDYQFLLDHNVTAVVNIRAEREDDLALYQQHGIDYVQIKVYDMLVPQNEHFDTGVAFIKRHIDKGGTVLIHCAKGRGRSAVLMAAYYMQERGISFEEAVALMEEKRPLVKQEARHKAAAEAWLATTR